ncbi:cytochrome P450 [Nonomuraea thailandensis]|uniref:Cytochrome P450 n=1 Tax=Nonomuraea thailandensis TaxID=1188745 RepID=A0A9X2JZV2_9ACTN|nr:cytochrome P450 [Nonomuraea thailandensis]MCP2355672.1 cytochrome P450 [Nonomuraea thailandensis]
MPDTHGLPLTRAPGCPFDPPPELAGIREQAPISPLTFPDGHAGWLVTGHALARAVLGDPRFSSRPELMHHPLPGVTFGETPPAAIGDLTGIDAPEHTRYRRLLIGRFTVRRMRLLTERVQEITAAQLDVLAEHGPPADLVRLFAQPVPALVICELLGVPYADRETFQRHAAVLAGGDHGPEEQHAAFGELSEYLHGLVLTKRSHPTDDLLSDLAGTGLDDQELAGIGAFLLGAGLDTTANMIALGTFALLSHPAQLAALREEPELADQAVEELLRYLSIAHTGQRAALEDVELGGRLVRAGETVVVSVQSANRDPDRFADPDRLDLRRPAVGHLAFGHGPHQCLGQQLARVELRVALPALIGRFPELRLAVPAGEVPLRGGLDIYGALRLPVAWGA